MPRARDRILQLSGESAEKIPDMAGDRPELERKFLQNLLEHAIQYTPSRQIMVSLVLPMF